MCLKDLAETDPMGLERLHCLVNVYNFECDFNILLNILSFSYDELTRVSSFAVFLRFLLSRRRMKMVPGPDKQSKGSLPCFKILLDLARKEVRLKFTLLWNKSWHDTNMRKHAYHF